MLIKDLIQPRWAVRLAGSPRFAALVAGAAAVVGLLGSVYQNEIAHSVPLVLFGPWTGWSGRAVVFWVALLLLALSIRRTQGIALKALARLEVVREESAGAAGQTSDAASD